jgi:hypothetical protein
MQSNNNFSNAYSNAFEVATTDLVARPAAHKIKMWAMAAERAMPSEIVD